MILPRIETPADLRALNPDELAELAAEIRAFIVEAVTTTGGHLGSNLGVVELTLALHRVFESPRDAILWDTGHQAYVHKLLTGRRYGFRQLRQAGGLSGYPNRAESEHDWIENSHASTVLSYAHGLASAFELQGAAVGHGGDRRVVAVVGDGALTGGMAYEALNNLGHSGRRVVVILNDNGRSYAPTVSHLSRSLTSLRLNPTYVQTRERLRSVLRRDPRRGRAGLLGHPRPHQRPPRGRAAAHLLRGARRPLRRTDRRPRHRAARTGAGPRRRVGRPDRRPRPHPEGPRLRPGRGGRGPAAPRRQGRPAAGRRRPGAPTRATTDRRRRQPAAIRPTTYTDAFTRALLRLAEDRPEVVALTAAMPGPTGLLPFQARFPDRFFDVGIAEQHEVTAAAGMAMGGLRPVVAVYSTFFSRAFDQANLDVGLHDLPVVFALDRAGITGDNGPSHHGVLDLALTLSIPGMTVFAPSSAEDLEAMLATALDLPGPSAIRFPKTPPPAPDGTVGDGGTAGTVGRLDARQVRAGDGSVCLLGVGKLVAACRSAADELARDGIGRHRLGRPGGQPPDPAMLADALDHRLVVTAEDGVRIGGAGTFLADALRAEPPTAAARRRRGRGARPAPGLHRRRAGPTTSSPASVSTAPAWRPASATR